MPAKEKKIICTFYVLIYGGQIFPKRTVATRQWNLYNAVSFFIILLFRRRFFADRYCRPPQRRCVHPPSYAIVADRVENGEIGGVSPEWHAARVSSARRAEAAEYKKWRWSSSKLGEIASKTAPDDTYRPYRMIGRRSGEFRFHRLHVRSPLAWTMTITILI